MSGIREAAEREGNNRGSTIKEVNPVPRSVIEPVLLLSLPMWHEYKDQVPLFNSFLPHHAIGIGVIADIVSRSASSASVFRLLTCHEYCRMRI